MDRTMKAAVSIIIPVFNEAHIISETLTQLRNLEFKKDFEIIIVDGCPRQSTLTCITESRVLKVVSKKGRGAQMNKGASVATGDILLFLHVIINHPVTLARLANKVHIQV